MSYKVSIVTPTYNCARYLESTVESIKQQSCQDFEVIFIDDGSSDQTLALLKSLTQAENISFYCQTHQGPGAARNLGLQKAQGEFVCFLDDDDLLHPESISKRLEILETHPKVGLVFSNYYQLKYEGEHTEPFLDQQNFLQKFKKAIKSRQGNVFLFNDQFFDCAMMYFPYILSSSVMIRKDVVTKVGYFEPSWRGSEDVDYWYRIIKHFDLAYLDEPLTQWRRHFSTVTKRVDSTFYRDTIHCYQRLKDNLGAKQYLKPVLNRRLSQYAFAGGYEAMNALNLNLARRFFFQAACYQPRQLKNWIYSGLSLLPKPVFKQLRALKQQHV